MLDSYWPLELVSEILKYLPRTDALSLTSTCSGWVQLRKGMWARIGCHPRLYSLDCRQLHMLAQRCRLQASCRMQRALFAELDKAARDELGLERLDMFRVSITNQGTVYSLGFSKTALYRSYSMLIRVYAGEGVTLFSIKDRTMDEIDVDNLCRGDDDCSYRYLSLCGDRLPRKGAFDCVANQRAYERMAKHQALEKARWICLPYLVWATRRAIERDIRDK